jgi:hypothetical protein
MRYPDSTARRLILTSLFLSAASAATACASGPIPIQAPATAAPFQRNSRLGDNLLYVTDPVAGGTFVFTYRPKRIRFVEFLSVPDAPVGECISRSGNIYIAGNRYLLFEYEPGGTGPIAMLSDQEGYIEGCAVDPATGSIAILSWSQKSSTTELALYRNIHAKPKYYSTGIHVMSYAAYDDSGDLFIDGIPFSGSSEFMLQELPKGASSAETISVDQTINWPGGLQWHQKRLYVGDLYNSIVYEFTVSGSSAQKVGSIALDGSQEVQQFTLRNGTLINPTFTREGSGPGYVDFYRYPSGGEPYHTISRFATPNAVIVYPSL